MKRVRCVGDWCERLRAAVADGRFLEDPAFWREHVEECEGCRNIAEGLFRLRARIEQAEQSCRVEVVETERGHGAVRDAIRKVRRERRARRYTAGLCVLLLLGLGFLHVISGSSDPAGQDSVAYAEQLHQRVFPRGAVPRADLLLDDPGLRDEYVAALDHASSLVRRTALNALTWSGVDVESGRFTRILENWDETLDDSLELAAAGDGRRYVEDALARRRDATLRYVLGGIVAQGSRGEPTVPTPVLLPFLVHPDAEVRLQAVSALGTQPDFDAAEDIKSVLEEDASAQVRFVAAQCLVNRLDERGAEVVVAHLRATNDFDFERRVIMLLRSFTVAREFAHYRLSAEDTPPVIAMLHFSALLTEDPELKPSQGLVMAVMKDSNVVAAHYFAIQARRGGWAEHRDALQKRWAGAIGDASRDLLAGVLVAWDLDSEDETRQHLALDMLVASRHLCDEEVLGRLKASPHASVKSRAEDLERELSGNR